MLKKMDRWAVVAQLVNGMRENQGWAGETHVQKALFFAQELLQVPCGYRFVLYKHGPYSFDLHDDLSKMLSNSILGLEPRPPYGPQLCLQDIGDRMVAQKRQVLEKYSRQANFIADTLSSKDVRELERLGTALLLKKELPGLDQATLAVRIIERKPHVSKDSALEAVQEMAQIEHTARRKNLIAS